MLAAAGGLLFAVGPARATTADDVCAPGANPCFFPKGDTLVVDPGSILDFGNRALIFPGGSGTKMDIGSGAVTIKAASMTMNPGSLLIGAPPCDGDSPPPGGLITIMVTGDFSVLRDGNTRARIDVSNCANPGGIFITAGGGVRIEGTLSAQGTQTEAGFGTMEIFAGTQVLVPGDISLAGGILADGGDLFVETDTGDINVSGIIDASGGNGGSVAFMAGDRVVTTEGALLSRIDTRATAGGGTGGIIDLSAGTDISIGSPLHAQGQADLFLGGDGGEVLLTAGSTVSIDRPVNLFGTVPDGVGGDADVFAALDIVQTGPIDASGKRTFGAGGIVELLAQRQLTVGSIDVSADCEDCAGGDLALEAWCGLTVPPTATLNAQGAVGIIGVRTGGPATVQGTLRAGGSVEFFHHPGVPAPVLTGATIVPTPTVATSPDVTRCGGPGSCDLDGMTEDGEECDDGNSNNCDSCSNSCKLVVCGNGRLDTPCEDCDDGNATDCDGCHGDCSRADDVCGDGITECGETCDSGSAVSCDAGDTCSAVCQMEACGNGIPECAEQCDEGAQNGQPGSRCAVDCTRLPPPNCGDGTIQADEGEKCDDHNVADCDDCNHFCEEESCGNNVRECLEECDDGNSSSCDGCTPGCLSEVCGNGRTDCGEECDAGEENGTPASGCLADFCRIGEICTTESTSPCIPCGTPVDCDPLGRCGNVSCEEGICTPSPLACDDHDGCTQDSCDPLAGCTNVPLAGFDSVRCRLADLSGLLADDALDEKGRKTLTKLHDAASAKLEKAASLVADGKPQKAPGKLRSAAKSLAKFSKKVVKLQPKHLTDPSLGTDLTDASDDTKARIEALIGTL